jgi:hypothetical protein
MTQRKLNPEELERVEQARHNLRGMCGWTTTDRGVDYWRGVDKELSKMLLHGTTDGRPLIEPQPEIGEGYRLATESDKGRRDLEFWSRIGGGWLARQATYGAPLDPDYHYRVPVDRIPTDEDARQRPTVMVRDNDKESWDKQTLLAVAGSFDKFVTSPGADISACFWMQARFPYPGELN